MVTVGDLMDTCGHQIAVTGRDHWIGHNGHADTRADVVPFGHQSGTAGHRVCTLKLVTGIVLKNSDPPLYIV